MFAHGGVGLDVAHGEDEGVAGGGFVAGLRGTFAPEDVENELVGSAEVVGVGVRRGERRESAGGVVSGVLEGDRTLLTLRGKDCRREGLRRSSGCPIYHV